MAIESSPMGESTWMRRAKCFGVRDGQGRNHIKYLATPEQHKYITQIAATHGVSVHCLFDNMLQTFLPAIAGKNVIPVVIGIPLHVRTDREQLERYLKERFDCILEAYLIDTLPLCGSVSDPISSPISS